MTTIPRVLDGWLVLVVDDEPDNLDVVRRLLNKAGAETVMAENGLQALHFLQTQRPHFILSDLSMPEMDGWMLMSELNQNRATADIPVIALTAHAMSGDRERAFEAGFVNYITKPIDASKFINNLLAILVSVPELKAQIREG